MKRLFDFVAASCAIFLLSPILICTAFAVRVFLGSPVLFVQERPGLNGRPFKMVKFRTMTNQLDDNYYLLPDAQRVTAFGGFLRSSSLDELPELWNIVTGDMSIVGPRPLLMEYLPLYNAEQARRHEVRPGLAGWAQVNGRNSVSWDEKFVMDTWYIDNQSFALDLKIIFLAVLKSLRREGIHSNESVTMEPFTGNQAHDE